MKQNINIGQVVDDGSGDYLRKGGIKINDNFDELYSELGDGSFPFSAGAWKTHSTTDSTTLEPMFGQSFAVNTQQGKINVKLPKGGPSDYNKVIRLRDVWGTWRLQPITVTPASGNTLKGNSSPKAFNTNYQDLELVFCPPGKWEYINGKTIEKYTNGDLATVAKKSFIATEGQFDFNNIFDGEEYNELSLNVYRRGNLLYYGETGFDELNADYGSPGSTSVSTDIVQLNKKDVRFKIPCNEGDVVVFETFLDGVGVFRSSYNKLCVMLLDDKNTTQVSIPGTKLVKPLATYREIFVEDLGVLPGVDMNPHSVEVELNGKTLVEAGTGGLPMFICEGAEAFSESDCLNNGGLWVNSNNDYRLQFDSTGTKVVSILFGQAFEDQDILSVRWYNNNIGTTLDIDDILSETDQIYLNSEQTIDLKNRIEYSDFNNPSQKTKTSVPNELMTRITNISAMFDILYPIGTIYENAHNSANPKDYMGFGVWKLWGQGFASVGWNSNASDPYFALNLQDLDSNGVPSHTAGGTIGEVSFNIKDTDIPELSSKDKVLVSDPNGTVVIGGCQLDPDSEGPGYSKYSEQILKVNKDVGGASISKIQPSQTVYRWIRVG